MAGRIGRWAIGLAATVLLAGLLSAQDGQEPPVDADQNAPVAEAPAPPAPPAESPDLPFRDPLTMARILVFEGGTIGWIIIALSVAMVALIFHQLLGVRRGRLMPWGLAEELHRQISSGNFKQAEELTRTSRSYLSRVVAAGLAEVQLGYGAVEKAMEDASQQHASRLFRTLEWFTVIGTIAPMLGLLGTVQGMIEAFMEFERKVNPQVSELAPGIYRALVTTFQGLCVAIPALAMYAVFRNRVDELVAQTSLMAEHVFSGYRRATAMKRLETRRAKPRETPVPPPPKPAP